MNYYKLYSLTKIGEKHVSDKIANLNMNYTEYQICSYLFFHRGISQDEISENLVLDKTTTSKSLKRLENSGLIVRKQDVMNRRKNIVDLTDEGMKQIENYVNENNKWFESICEDLSSDEQEAFEATLLKMLNNAISKFERKMNE